MTLQDHPAPRTNGTAAGPETGGTRSLGDIVGDISQDLSTLVHQEIDLAKAELKQQATRAGKGAGMFGGAGVAGFLTLLFLSLAATYLLDNWLPLELAALVVALVWGATTAVLALRGKKEIQQTEPLPITQQSVKEDIQWARAQKS